MSLNLGNEAVSALAELRGNPHFDTFRSALGQRVYDLINESVDAPIEQRVEKTSYARAVRDVWIAFESALTGTRQNTIKPPQPPRSKGDIL